MNSLKLAADELFYSLKDKYEDGFLTVGIGDDELIIYIEKKLLDKSIKKIKTWRGFKVKIVCTKGIM